MIRDSLIAMLEKHRGVAPGRLGIIIGYRTRFLLQRECGDLNMHEERKSILEDSKFWGIPLTQSAWVEHELAVVQFLDRVEVGEK